MIETENERSSGKTTSRIEDVQCVEDGRTYRTSLLILCKACDAEKLTSACSDGNRFALRRAIISEELSELSELVLLRKRDSENAKRWKTRRPL